MEAWREELYRNELYHAYEAYYSDELYHYGIPGMKWYIRRFQNPDGSLTDRGRKRYGVGPAIDDPDFTEDYSLNKKYVNDRNAYLAIERTEAEREDRRRTKAAKKKQKKQTEEEEEVKKTDDEDDKKEANDKVTDGLTKYTPKEEGDKKKKDKKGEEESKTKKDEEESKTKKEEKKDEPIIGDYGEAREQLSKAASGFALGGQYENKTVENTRNFVNNQTWTRKSKRQLDRMSNEEFDSLLKRMELEKKYSSLTANDVLEGRHKASNLLYDVGALTAVAAGVAGTAAAVYALKKKIDG